MTQAPEQQPIAYAQQTPPPPPHQVGPPPSNVGWAVAAVVFFFPFAFVAFTNSLNVFPLWAQGDLQGAQEASGKARFWGWFSLGAFVVSVLLLLLSQLVAHLVTGSSRPPPAAADCCGRFPRRRARGRARLPIAVVRRPIRMTASTGRQAPPHGAAGPRLCFPRRGETGRATGVSWIPVKFVQRKATA